MLKIFIDSFKTTNGFVILVTPLIVFCTLFTLYYNFAMSLGDTLSKYLISIVTGFVILSAFIASWLYTIKKAVLMSKKVYVFENDKNKALMSLFWCLFKGIGKLVLPVAGFLALNFLFYFVLWSFIAFLTNVFPELLYYHAQLLMVGFYIISFVTVLWLPEIVFSKRNVLVSLFKSIKKVFDRYTNTVILYLFILALFTINVSLIFHYIFIHPVLSFFILMMFYYVILYIVVLLFTYYEQQFLSEN